MSDKLIVSGVTLPSPTSVAPSFEILWSSNTGRSATTGKMLGAVVAEKKTLEVEWVNITADEFATIASTLKAGFFGPVLLEKADGNAEVEMESAYRSSFTTKSKGTIGGIHYYSSVKVSLIER